MRYEYNCSICGGEVVKKPTGEKVGKGPERVGLGGWRCSVDGAGIKVIRRMKER